MAQERSLLPGQNYCDYCSIQRFYAGRHPREYAADGARRYHSMGGLYRALSFATMADLFPGSVFVQTDQSDYANYVEVKQDILVPVQVSVSQRGRLYRKLCTGREFIGGLLPNPLALAGAAVGAGAAATR